MSLPMRHNDREIVNLRDNDSDDNAVLVDGNPDEDHSDDNNDSMDDTVVSRHDNSVDVDNDSDDDAVYESSDLLTQTMRSSQKRGDPKEKILELFCKNFAEQRTGVCINSQSTPYQNVRKNVLASMKTIFPNISESSKECKSLVNIITKTVRKVSTNDETKERHDAVLVICKTLMKLFPQRALFSILQRWSQKPKNHFLMDAINVVTVLASHYGQLRMDQFLDKART